MKCLQFLLEICSSEIVGHTVNPDFCHHWICMFDIYATPLHKLMQFQKCKILVGKVWWINNLPSDLSDFSTFCTIWQLASYLNKVKIVLLAICEIPIQLIEYNNNIANRITTPPCLGDLIIPILLYYFKLSSFYVQFTVMVKLIYVVDIATLVSNNYQI